MNREDDKVYIHIHVVLAVIQWDELNATDWANLTLRCGKTVVSNSMDQNIQAEYPSDRAVSKYD